MEEGQGGADHILAKEQGEPREESEAESEEE
jgi:hypothetical protein